MITKHRVQILFQTRKKDEVTERKIPKFLPYYMNVPKSINAELDFRYRYTYVTAYVPSCCRIPHILTSVLTEYLTSNGAWGGVVVKVLRY